VTRRTFAGVAVGVLVLMGIAPAALGQGIDDPIPAKIKPAGVKIALKRVAGGFDAPVWAGPAPGAANANRLFVADQTGKLYAVNLDTHAKRVFLDASGLLVPLGVGGPGTYDERGFLGFAFDPGYAQNGILYTYTSEPATGTPDYSTIPPGAPVDHQNVVRSWHVPQPGNAGSVVDPKSSRELLRVDWPQFNHDAGALVFGRDKMLYISMGDGGGADDQDRQETGNGPAVGHGPTGNGQNLGVPLGKILRINPHGSNSANGQYGIPPGNPFVGRSGAAPEVWALGFRNPFRFSFDRATGRLVVADVGQNDIEEVDVVHRGANYGWRVKEGTFLFDPAGFGVTSTGASDGFVFANSPTRPSGLVDPIAEYDHDEGIAAIGGFVYRGPRIEGLTGRYVFGDLARTFDNDGRLFVLRGHEIRQLKRLGMFLDGFGQGRHGELYVLGNHTGTPSGATGQVLRIVQG
jgi:glucose/arabinose dehydrogenase